MSRLTNKDPSGSWEVKGIPWNELSPEQMERLKESIPEPIAMDEAGDVHEASYIKGWNDCLGKITAVQ